MKRFIAITGTILLHLLLLLALLPVVPTQQPAGDTDRPQDVKSLKGGQGLVEAKIIAGEGLSGASCQGGSYVGIGLTVGRNGFIMMVGENTPASRAGLERGDVILNEGDLWIKEWKEGDIVVIKLHNREVSMKTEKICYDS